MSRLGKKPLPLAAGATLEQSGRAVTMRGPRGTLTWTLPAVTELAVEGNTVRVRATGADRHTRALHGLTRQMLANMAVGVTAGYRKQLEMKGTGYRAEVQGTDLTLSAGYSHPVRIIAPEGITFTVEKNVWITVEGNDKQLVGEVAAKIRAVRPPEPYKGKGIRYAGETIRLKPGKTVKAAAAA